MGANTLQISSCYFAWSILLIRPEQNFRETRKCTFHLAAKQENLLSFCFLYNIITVSEVLA